MNFKFSRGPSLTRLLRTAAVGQFRERFFRAIGNRSEGASFAAVRF